MAKLGVATLLCLAFVLFGFTSATELHYDSNDVDLEPLYVSEKALKIDINKLVDINVNIIRELLKKIDPIRLLRIPLLGRGSLSNGRLNNLSQIYRSKNCTIQYANKVISIDLNFGWDDINVHYDYDLKLWLSQRYGIIESGISTLKINLAVGVDLARYRVVLQSLKFTEVGKFSLKIKGSTGDKIRSFFVKLIMNLLQKQIVTSIEEKTVSTLSAVVDEVNKNIPDQRHQFTFSYPASARQLDINAFQYVEIEESSVGDLTIY